MIDEIDGTCSELNRLMEEVCHVGDSNAEETDGDYVDILEEIDQDADEYDECEIGKELSTTLEINSFKDSEVCETTNGRSLFNINFSVRTADNKIKRYRVLLDSGATCNVVPASFVELLM